MVQESFQSNICKAVDTSTDCCLADCMMEATLKVLQCISSSSEMDPGDIDDCPVPTCDSMSMEVDPPDDEEDIVTAMEDVDDSGPVMNSTVDEESIVCATDDRERFTCVTTDSIQGPSNITVESTANCLLDAEIGFDVHLSDNCTCSSIVTDNNNSTAISTMAQYYCGCAVCPPGSAQAITWDCSYVAEDLFLVGDCEVLGCDGQCLFVGTNDTAAGEEAIPAD
jgi:hypothetical protein